MDHCTRKELLNGKETLVKGIKNKDKKTYNAVVKIGEKGYALYTIVTIYVRIKIKIGGCL